MKLSIKKYACIFILLLQTSHLFTQVDPAFKHYNGAIISTLSIGLAMQTAGIALLAYSNNYFLAEISPLKAEKNLVGSTAAIEKTLKEKQGIYDSYFISSTTLFSIGTMSTVVGLGLVLARSIQNWKQEKNSHVDKTYKRLSKISTVRFSRHVKVSMYSLYPAIFVLSIK